MLLFACLLFTEPAVTSTSVPSMTSAVQLTASASIVMGRSDTVAPSTHLPRAPVTNGGGLSESELWAIIGTVVAVVGVLIAVSVVVVVLISWRVNTKRRKAFTSEHCV